MDSKTDVDAAPVDAAVSTRRCFAGEWNPDGRYRYCGKDYRQPKGEAELHCDDFETLVPGCVGLGMSLHNEFDEVFFVPDGDATETGGYFCTSDELVAC